LQLYDKLCHDINIQSGALLPLLEAAGIEGYEMQSKIMRHFNWIRNTEAIIAEKKRQDKK